MKKRGILAVIVLSIITFGIYDLFWLASVKKGLNEQTNVKVPTLWLLFGPVLLAVVVTFLLTAAGGFKHDNVTTNRIQSGSLVTTTTTTTSTPTALGIGMLGLDAALILAAMILSFYWLFKFSKAVNEYTKGEMSTAVSFLLLYLLRFIGIALIQDKINEILDAGVAPVNPGLPAEQVATGEQPVVNPVSPQTPESIPVNPEPVAPEAAPQPQPPAEPASENPPTDPSATPTA